MPGGIADRDPHREGLDLLACPPDLLAKQVRRGLAGEDRLGGDLLPGRLRFRLILHHHLREVERVVCGRVATDNLAIVATPHPGRNPRRGGIDEDAHVGPLAPALSPLAIDRPQSKPILPVGRGPVDDRPGLGPSLAGLLPSRPEILRSLEEDPRCGVVGLLGRRHLEGDREGRVRRPDQIGKPRGRRKLLPPGPSQQPQKTDRHQPRKPPAMDGSTAVPGDELAKVSAGRSHAAESSTPRRHVPIFGNDG